MFLELFLRHDFIRYMSIKSVSWYHMMYHISYFWDMIFFVLNTVYFYKRCMLWGSTLKRVKFGINFLWQVKRSTQWWLRVDLREGKGRTRTSKWATTSFSSWQIPFACVYAGRPWVGGTLTHNGSFGGMGFWQVFFLHGVGAWALLQFGMLRLSMHLYSDVLQVINYVLPMKDRKFRVKFNVCLLDLWAIF